MGKAQEYLSRHYGFEVDTQETPDLVLAAGAVQQILLNNPNRMGWTIINEAAGVMNAAFPGAAPSATHGIRFAPAGGWRSTTVDYDGTLPTQALYAYSLVGTTLYLQETLAL